MDYLQEIKEIREKLEYYAKLYYDEDAPVISDYEYDMLNNRLKALEREHPDAITPDSPTQKVGGHRSEKFSPVTHEVPLESLADIFSYEELEDFIRKTDAALGGDVVYTVEPKIDGLSMALEYRNGIFLQRIPASSRSFFWTTCSRSWTRDGRTLWSIKSAADRCLSPAARRTGSPISERQSGSKTER